MINLKSILLGLLTCAVLIGISSFAEIPVRGEKVVDLLTTVHRSAPATVVSLRQPTIASEIIAYIIDIPINPGDLVKEGQLLVKLECTDHALKLQQAKAELAALSARQTLARQQLARLNKLLKNRNASEDQANQQQAELDVVKAKINAQKISIASAKHVVSRCQIMSPFPGQVNRIIAQPGSYAIPGTPLIDLIDLKRIELAVQINDKLSNELTNDNEFSYRYLEQNYPVALRTVYANVDAIAKTRELRFVFTGELPSVGSSGRLQWILPGRFIPPSLLVKRGEDYGVFVARSGIAVYQAITGYISGQPISTDLGDEEILITEGRHSLKDQDKIKLINE